SSTGPLYNALPIWGTERLLASSKNFRPIPEDSIREGFESRRIVQCSESAWTRRQRARSRVRCTFGTEKSERTPSRPETRPLQNRANRAHPAGDSIRPKSEALLRGGRRKGAHSDRGSAKHTPGRHQGALDQPVERRREALPQAPVARPLSRPAQGDDDAASDVALEDARELVREAPIVNDDVRLVRPPDSRCHRVERADG